MLREQLTGKSDHFLVEIYAEQVSLFWLEEYACGLYADRVGEDEYFRRYAGAMDRRQNMVHTRFCRAMRSLSRAKALGLNQRELAQA